MSESRHAVKVGLFGVLAIVVLAALISVFSKGTGRFTSTYEVRLRARTVSGLQQGSIVLMSGVPVGTVAGAELTPDGKGVFIRVRIKRQYPIHRDARFVIEQIGFLGDQYVAIYPQENQAPLLQPGDEVPVEEPFNWQETARSATGLLEEARETVKLLRESVARLERTVLSETTLSNATLTLGNFHEVSGRVLTMVDGINRLVETNSRPIFLSVSNLVHFSEELDRLAAELTQTVATNRVELTKAISSLESTARVLERMAHSVEAGRGLAGALLQDEQLKASVASTIQHLQTVSSNISRFGLLYKPRPPRTNPPVKQQFPGRNPFD